jgi:hypothetical protein
VYTRGELVQAISPADAKFSSEGLKAERKGQRVGRISGLVAYKDGFVVSTHAGALLIYRLDTGSGMLIPFHFHMIMTSHHQLVSATNRFEELLLI